MNDDTIQNYISESDDLSDTDERMRQTMSLQLFSVGDRHDDDSDEHGDDDETLNTIREESGRESGSILYGTGIYARPLDREVFVSPEEDMFAASASPGLETSLTRIQTVLESTRNQENRNENNGGPVRQIVRARIVSVDAQLRVRLQQMTEQQPTPYPSNPRPSTDLDPPMLNRWMWLLNITGDSEWLRRCRATYAVDSAPHNTNTVHHNWEFPPKVKESIPTEFNNMMLPIDILQSCTSPYKYQIPQGINDSSGIDSGEITAYDVCYGADPQGISWGTPWSSRERFRNQRLRDIQLQSDFRSMSSESGTECFQQVQHDLDYLHVACRQQTRYHYWKTIRCVPRPTADHFQLRHLIHAVSSTDVILSNASTSGDSGTKLPCSAINTTTGKMVWIHGRQWGPQRAGYRIRGISSMHSRFGFVASGYLDSRVSVSDLGRNYEALDSIEDDEKDCCTKSSMLDDGDEDHCSYDGGFFRCEQHRSNCSVDEELGLPTAVLSSYSGRRADERPVVWRGRKVLNLLRISPDADNIVNCVSIEPGSWTSDYPQTSSYYSNSSLQDVSLFTACNDHSVAEWTLYGRLKWKIMFQWCANHFAISPTRRLMSIGADSRRIVMLDLISKRPVITLEGHRDFTFSSAWHPDPNSFLFASGNQDSTCRIWDIRKPRDPLFTLGSACSAVRCVAFSPDGQTLAFAESKDVLCLYNVHSQFQECDCIDYFGECTGLSFSPDSSRLFAGIAEPTYGGLLELRKGIPKPTLGRNDNVSLREPIQRLIVSEHNETENTDGKRDSSMDLALEEFNNLNKCIVTSTHNLNTQIESIKSFYKDLEMIEDGQLGTKMPIETTGTPLTSSLAEKIAMDAADLFKKDVFPIAESETKLREEERLNDNNISAKDGNIRTFISHNDDEAENNQELQQRNEEESIQINSDLLSNWIEALAASPLSTNLYSNDRLRRCHSSSDSSFLSSCHLNRCQRYKYRSLYNPLLDCYSVPCLVDEGISTGRSGWVALWDPTVPTLSLSNSDRLYSAIRLLDRHYLDYYH